jgi:hypothetical protein
MKYPIIVATQAGTICVTICYNKADIAMRAIEEDDRPEIDMVNAIVERNESAYILDEAMYRAGVWLHIIDRKNPSTANKIIGKIWEHGEWLGWNFPANIEEG